MLRRQVRLVVKAQITAGYEKAAIEGSASFCLCCITEHALIFGELTDNR